MNKKNKKLRKIIKSPLLMTILLAVAISCIGISVVSAATYLFNSSDVKFDNTDTQVTANNVQGAIDELYNRATNYDSMNTRANTEQEKLDNIQQMKFDNAGFHNSFFRGKDVTSYVTDGSLFTRISSGKFTDLYVGDYVVINNITWRIAGFDMYYRKGDTALTTHHAVIVPDSRLANSVMNDTNTTEGGYVGSKMYTTTLPNTILPIVEGAFGNHVLTYRAYLTNSVSTTVPAPRIPDNSGTITYGASNGTAWYNAKVNLMNMVQVTGNVGSSSSGYDIRADNVQFPLFYLAPEFINKERGSYWVRDVASTNRFALIQSTGSSTVLTPSNSYGVRPYFYID